MENVLAKLENGKYGLTFSSGLGAVSTLICTFKTGDNIIIGDDIYGGSLKLFKQITNTFNIELTLVDLSDINNLTKAIKPNTKVRKFIFFMN